MNDVISEADQELWEQFFTIMGAAPAAVHFTAEPTDSVMKNMDGSWEVMLQTGSGQWVALHEALHQIHTFAQPLKQILLPTEWDLFNVIEDARIDIIGTQWFREPLLERHIAYLAREGLERPAATPHEVVVRAAFRLPPLVTPEMRPLYETFHDDIITATQSDSVEPAVRVAVEIARWARRWRREGQRRQQRHRRGMSDQPQAARQRERRWQEKLRGFRTAIQDDVRSRLGELAAELQASAPAVPWPIGTPYPAITELTDSPHPVEVVSVPQVPYVMSEQARLAIRGWGGRSVGLGTTGQPTPSVWRLPYGARHVFRHQSRQRLRLLLMIDASASMYCWCRSGDWRGCVEDTPATLAWDVAGMLSSEFDAKTYAYTTNAAGAIVVPLQTGYAPVCRREWLTGTYAGYTSDCAMLQWLARHLGGETDNVVVVVITDGQPVWHGCDHAAAHTAALSRQLSRAGVRWMSVHIQSDNRVYPSECVVHLDSVREYERVYPLLDALAR